MKPQNPHAHEDRLLDFAYGELPAQEARVVESHLQGCTRCTELLDGIRGVRTSMAQLTLEPAPDAGLESLLAYAQQAARNTAAGPPLKPTWWRRWLVPAMGVAAVSVFGIVTIQVNKSVDLSPDLTSAVRQEAQKEALPVASATPAPAMVAENVPPSEAMPASPSAAAEPPKSEAVAKLDPSSLDKFKAKDAPRKKEMRPSVSYDNDADSSWGNAGAGVGRALERESDEKGKNYTYDRRDARTQSGAFADPKPMLVEKNQPPAPLSPAPTTAPTQAAPPPPPAAAQPGGAPADEAMAGATMDDAVQAAEPQVQQQGPSRGSLRLGEAKRDAAKPAADKGSEDDAFDELFSGRSGSTRREQSPSAPEVASVSKPAAPKATAAKPTGGAAAAGKAENQVSSPAELSKLATTAMRSGDRVREALYLRQALEAGATGKERLGLLNRLCDAEFSIGRRQAALEACNLVLEEDPRSSAAQVARRRLSQEAPAQAKPDSRLSAPKSASPLRADDMEAPASAPSQSY